MVSLGLGNAQFGTLYVLTSSGSLYHVSIISSPPPPKRKTPPRTTDVFITAVYDHELLENIWTLCPFSK